MYYRKKKEKVNSSWCLCNSKSCIAVQSVSNVLAGTGLLTNLWTESCTLNSMSNKYFFDSG